MTESVRLLNNASATGEAKGWPGGAGVFTAAGSFSGATVKLQQLAPDGVTWLDISGGAVDLSAPGQGGFVLPAGPIRADVSGGAPAGLHAIAVQV